jgi:hypothetical protein
MTKHILTFALLLSAGVAAASPQPNLPEVPAAPTTPAAATAPAQTSAADPIAITPEKLVSILADLGYEPKDVSLNGTKDYYQITSERNGWKLFITVSFSSDRSTLWLGVKFKQLDNTAAASPDSWLKLLELTNTYYPVHFALDETPRIHVWMAIPNAALDATELRTQIEYFDEVVRTTQPSWISANFVAK